MLLMPPTIKHLARMYAELARHGARAVGADEEWPYRYDSLEDLLALAADMSRYDPRLFSILVEFLFSHWGELNPLKMRTCMRSQKSPQSLLVMMAFVVAGVQNEEAGYLLDYLARGYTPVPPQLYFLGLHLPGSHSMDRVITEPLEEFSSWGFLARERPIIHDQTRTILGHWGTAARQNVISRLISSRGSITVSDYLAAVEHSISRQQALNDLKESRFVKMQGKGRAAVWVGHKD